MRPSVLAAIATVFLPLLSEPAEALRCGNKLVIDGMHELEVRRACGEPVSTKHLGYIIRRFGPIGGHDGRRHPDNRQRQFWHSEVPVTELIYNFGPHRLMRKLRFEGDILTSIRTMGYGYNE